VGVLNSENKKGCGFEDWGYFLSSLEKTKWVRTYTDKSLGGKVCDEGQDRGNRKETLKWL